MKTTFGNLIKCLLALVLIEGVVVAYPQGLGGGSRCPGTSCTSAPPGMQCQANYGRDNGCCPEWNCGGQVFYGMSQGGGGSSFQSFSSSTGSGGGSSFSSFSTSSGGAGAGNQLANMMSNIFGMFGR